MSIYLENTEIEYKGIQYIFDPYAFGNGAWRINDKSQKIVDKNIQELLNLKVFGSKTLPNFLERLNMMNHNERQKMKNISMSWLMDKINGIKNGSSVDAMNYGNPFKPVVHNRFIVGGMYFYVYDAKHKATLPVWDAFPLTILLEYYPDGFLGMNLHYIDVIDRAKLMVLLLNQYGKLNSNDLKLSISYDIFKTLSKTNKYDVCIKRYLYDKVYSNIIPLEPHEWAYSLFLPVQDFRYNVRT